MKLFDPIKESLVRVKAYWPDYLKSSLILQLIRVLLVLPLLSFIFYKMLSKAGIAGVTNENYLSILRNPLALLLGLLLLVVFVFFIFYELGYYFVLGDKQIKQVPISFRLITKELNHKAPFFLSLNSFLLVGYFLLVLPIVSVGLSSKLTTPIKIPDFIIDELLNTQPGKLLYAGLLVVLFYVALRLLYSVYFFVSIQELTIWEAFKKSWHYSQGRSWRNFFLLAVVTLGFASLLVFTVFLLLIPLLLVEKIFPFLAPIMAGLTITLIQLVVFFLGGMLQPVIANVILATHFSQEQLSNRVITPRESPINWLKKHPRLLAIASFAAVALVLFNTWSTITIIYVPQTQIIAHRGFMEKGVENSIGGLIASADANADFVELDIQETKDQQFVVMHDYNLKRLASVNQEVRNLTLKELEGLTIKQGGFQDKIPSLLDFIHVAKEQDIKLLIEVKPHGYESAEMAKNLVALLQAENVTADFLVQSLDKGILDELKKEDPTIKTGYIIPLNIGNLPVSEHDFYVLEEFSVSASLLTEAEEMNKEVFVWTVNKDELLKKYLRLDVDGIITNHPDRGLAMRESREDTKNFFNRVQFLLEE